MPEDRLPRLVIPDSVCEGRAGRGIFAIQMANTELAGPLLVFVKNEQCCVPAVWRREVVSGRVTQWTERGYRLFAYFAISLTLYLCP